MPYVQQHQSEKRTVSQIPQITVSKKQKVKHIVIANHMKRIAGPVNADIPVDFYDSVGLTWKIIQLQTEASNVSAEHTVSNPRSVIKSN